MNEEIRVFVLLADQTDKYPNDMTDAEFIEACKEYFADNYSLKQFQNEFNEGEDNISTNSHFIRFIAIYS